MPATFSDINRRLVMRYYQASTFSFNSIRRTATNQQIHDLATAISSIQSRQPTKVSVVVTQQLQF